MHTLNQRRFLKYFSVLTLGLTLVSQSVAHAITFLVDETGYHPNAPKRVIIQDVPATLPLDSTEVLLIDPNERDMLSLSKGKVMHRVTEVKRLKKPQTTSGPLTETWVLDFSEFQQPGAYDLTLVGTGDKTTIKISEFHYWDTLKPVIRSFFLQRSGQEIRDPLTDIYHTAGHVDDATLISNQNLPGTLMNPPKDVTGGWYDAGDYAKHTMTTSLTVSKLAALYEWNPDPLNFLSLDYPLGEPGAGEVPDYLHEVKVGSDWLLSMQRRDGAFYSKVAGLNWPGIVTPQDDTQDRYIFGATTQDTAAAVAALASTARSFKKKDIGYTVKCLMAAERGWRFLHRNGPTAEVTPQDTKGSRQYLNLSNLKNDTPYRLWAAAELYLTTGKETYHQYFLTHLLDVPLAPVSWKNPALQGITNYVLYAKQPHPKTKAALTKVLIQMADSTLEKVKQTPYTVKFKNGKASSNPQILEDTSLLLIAYRLTEEEKYHHAATQSTRYLFGLNPLDKSFVTGIGNNSVEHPHHRLMQATGKIIPGMVVGGPGARDLDAITGSSLPPLKTGVIDYADEPTALRTNEPAIEYNARLAYVLGVLNAIYNTKEEEFDPSRQQYPPGLE